MFRSTLAFFFFLFPFIFFLFVFQDLFLQAFSGAEIRGWGGGWGAALATGGTLIFLLFSAPFAASFVLMV